MIPLNKKNPVKKVKERVVKSVLDVPSNKPNTKTKFVRDKNIIYLP